MLLQESAKVYNDGAFISCNGCAAVPTKTHPVPPPAIGDATALPIIYDNTFWAKDPANASVSCQAVTPPFNKEVVDFATWQKFSGVSTGSKMVKGWPTAAQIASMADGILQW